MFKGVNPCFWLVKSVDLHGSVGTHGSIDIRAGLDARSEAEIRYEVWDAKENYLEVQGPGPWSWTEKTIFFMFILVGINNQQFQRTIILMEISYRWPEMMVFRMLFLSNMAILGIYVRFQGCSMLKNWVCWKTNIQNLKLPLRKGETSTQTNILWVPFVCFQGCTCFLSKPLKKGCDSLCF